MHHGRKTTFGCWPESPRAWVWKFSWRRCWAYWDTIGSNVVSDPRISGQFEWNNFYEAKHEWKVGDILRGIAKYTNMLWPSAFLFLIFRQAFCDLTLELSSIIEPAESNSPNLNKTIFWLRTSLRTRTQSLTVVVSLLNHHTFLLSSRTLLLVPVVFAIHKILESDYTAKSLT